MSFQPDKKRRREAACQRRAKRAFLLAKLMVPALFLSVSASAWSDPVLGPRLESGLEEVRPMVQAVLDGEPVMEVLAQATRRPAAEGMPADAETPAEGAVDAQTASALGLPTSVVPINRPLSRPVPAAATAQ